MARDEIDSIMNLADEKLSEMCKELCHLVTIELQKATDSLVSQVEQKLEVRKVPTASRAWEGETLHEVEGASEFQSFLGDDCVHAVNPKYLDDVGEKRPEKKPTLAWGTKISPENDESEAHPSPSEPNAPGGPTGAVKLNQSLSMKAQRETMIERIFGLVPDVGGGLQEDNMSQGRKQVLRFISSNCFEGFGIVMILLYSLEIGLQINYLAETRALDPGHVWRTIDWAFCLWFTVEVGLKLYVYRMRFFTMHGCAWNIMDFFLNILQIFEEVVAIVSLASANTQTVLNSGVMRTVRICRGIKVMRLVRTVRFAEELQLIVSCLILSVRTFLCVLSLLVMAIYVMAIYATQAVYVYHLENPVNPEGELVQRWGNIPTSMLSVFQALSGGVDWNDISKPLMDHISPWFGYLFVGFVAYCVLALLNVITGTFVEAVSRQADHLKVRMQILQARKVFQQMDMDGSGSISLQELRNQTLTPTILDFFDYVNVDPSEAQYLLEVLDGDGSGTIAFEEFLQGTLRLNCSARAADMLLVVREIKRFFVHYNAEMQLIKRHLHIIK